MGASDWRYFPPYLPPLDDAAAFAEVAAADAAYPWLGLMMPPDVHLAAVAAIEEAML